MTQKVAFVLFSCESGGVLSVTQELCEAFSVKYEVHLISLTRVEKPIKKIENVLLKDCAAKKTTFLSVFKDSFYELVSYLNEKQIDIVVFQTPYIGALSIFVKFFSRKSVKCICCDHGSFVRSQEDLSIKDKVLYYLSLYGAEKTVLLNARIAEIAKKQYGAPLKKLVTIPNWHNGSIKYHANTNRLLSVGRLSQEKGFDRLIRVFELVHKIQPDCVLDIVGDGPLRSELELQVVKKKLDRSVFFWGMQEDIGKFYEDSIIYILPSYREGMPRVLLEAKEYCLPIVAFDILTGPREIVQDGVDGFLVEDGNIEEMAQRIIQLIEDPKLREEFSKNSTKILELYSKDRILKQWYKLFQSL